MVEVEMSVDGTTVAGVIDERTLLIDFLRDHAGVKGVRNGCLEARCGCCAVLLDDRSVKSCNVLAVQADGKSITTVAGLAAQDSVPDWGQPLEQEQVLSDLQEAFIRHGAVQCGFCTSGMLVVLTDALASREVEDEDDVRECIRGNLCRCTGYQKIVDAALDVVEARNRASR